jgi:hypothetical protein
LAPFYRTHRRIYTGYLDVLTPAENQKRLADLAAERERVRRLDAATLVAIVPDGAENDAAHNQQGQDTSIVRTEGRAGRRAAKWFSYDLSTAGTPAALVVTYNTDNRRDRSFDVLVNGVSVGRERFPFDSVSRFFDREYVLPPSLAGATTFTIRVEATSALETAPVYHLRLVRDTR